MCNLAIHNPGYAAGYYSYKWAEVMACDAFSLFKEQGIFDRASSEKFKKTFLESGGAISPMDLFIAFRGRRPSIDALLRNTGIIDLQTDVCGSRSDKGTRSGM